MQGFVKVPGQTRSTGLDATFASRTTLTLALIIPFG
jgi:hypothetical protein